MRPLLVAALAVAVTVAAPAPAPAADPVAAYLEQEGLLELLTVHLETQLEDAAPVDRAELVVRLAEIYAQLLPTIEDDPVRSAAIVERSRRLLAHAPAGSANELSLALLRLRYRTAEETAERHRLRLASDEEVDRARSTLDDVASRLRRLLDAMDKQVDRADRRLSRAQGTEAIMLREEMERAGQLHAQCQFLTAWTTYYGAWLASPREREPVRYAERLFAELLGFGDRPAVPEDVSVDLRSTEAFARCMQGTALCRSITSATDTALDWVELLRHPRTFGPVREQATAWELAILLEHGEFLRARTRLDTLTADGEEILLQWLRLLAVHALESASVSGQAAELAREAVTAMAARGELGQVFDLASRYGVAALGTSGFAMHYVAGVLKYYQARDLHGDEEPSPDPEVVRLYGEAIVELDRAQAAADAERYAGSRADCIRVTAWCSFFAGELLRAREAFELAAEVLPPQAAADALWMAIVCLDRLTTADDRSLALEDDLARLIARFLERYPASEHAPKLILRRALASEVISPELAEELLAIPESSDVYRAARRRATQILYRLFRDSRGAERITYGTRFLTVAVPMQAREETRLEPAEPASLQRYLVRARRILEVALYEGIGRAAIARTVLDGLRELGEEGADLESIAPELDYRRVRERLLGGDPVTADVIAETLWEAEPGGLWARLAARAVYADAERERRAAETPEAARAAVALVLKHGHRVLLEFAGDPTALGKPDVLAFHMAVADAALEVWQRSGDPDRGRRALALYERLLSARPRNARFLRATALLSEGVGDPERAIDCWRTLVAGSGQATDAWFEAKYHLISLLADHDPARARLVMDQHKLLNPDYGPGDWGSKLRRLDARLRVSAGENAGAAAEGGCPLVADPFKRFLGLEAGADPAALLGLGPPPHPRVRVEAALRTRLAQVYSHRDGGTLEAEAVRVALRRAAAELSGAASPGAARPDAGERTGARPPRAPARRPALTEFDRFVLAMLVAFGGWNVRSRAKLVALAASYGVTAAGLMKVIRGLHEYARSGGPPVGVSDLAPGTGRLETLPRAAAGRAPAGFGAALVERLAADRWMPELREPSLGSTIKLSFFFGVVTLFLAAMFLRALLPASTKPPGDAMPVVTPPIRTADPGASPVTGDPSPGDADAVVSLARFDPLPGFLGNAVPLDAANAAYEATQLPGFFDDIARKVSITDEPAEAVYRSWVVSIRTMAVGWVLVDESTRQENDRAIRAVLHEARHAPAVGDRLLHALVPHRERLATPTQVWEGAWQAGTLGSIAADRGLPAAIRESARRHLEVTMVADAVEVRDFASGASLWLDRAADALVDVLELQPDVYDFWEMWIAAERELGDDERLQTALMRAAELILATSTNLSRPGPSVNVLVRLLTTADFESSDVVRLRLVALFDDVDRVGAHDLWVVTSLLAQLDTVPWFDAELVLPAEAGLTFRNRIRDRVAAAWPRDDRAAEGLVRQATRGIRVDARIAVRWFAWVNEVGRQSLEERDDLLLMSWLVAASRLNEAALLLASGGTDAAVGVLDEMEGALECASSSAQASPGPGRVRGLQPDPGRTVGPDGEWAEAFAAARRNAEERLTLLQAVRNQPGSDLGPLDAEVFVRAAYLGTLREIRSLARAILVERFVDGRRVTLELLDQFPDAPRRDGIADTIQRYTGRLLPPERSESWVREARLALVEHVLELLPGGTSRVDALTEALRDSYARRAAVLAQDPSLQVAAASPQAAAAIVTDARRDRAAVLVACAMVPDTIAGLARRRVIRHRLGEGPIQTLVVEQLSTLDYLTYLTVAERPEVEDDAWAILLDSGRRRHGVPNALHQAIEAELAIARMWSLRMGLATDGASGEDGG